jgi:hypothetical protein
MGTAGSRRAVSESRWCDEIRVVLAATARAPPSYWSDHRLWLLRQSRLDLLDHVRLLEAGKSVHEPGATGPRACGFLLVGTCVVETTTPAR